MLRGFFFLFIALPYLWILDFWILFLRLTKGIRGVEILLDRKVQSWSHGVINLMNLIQGTRVIHEKPAPGARELPKHFMVVCNHQSLLDILLFFDLFKGRQIRFVAKKSLGKSYPAVSQTLVYQKHALIERDGNLRSTLKELKALAERNKKTGFNAVIFPEGTRSKDGELRTFHAAGFKILADTDPCPIVVCAMDGAWKIATLLDFMKARNVKVHMRMLDVLPCPQNKDELKATLEQCKDIINRQLTQWRSLPD